MVDSIWKISSSILESFRDSYVTVVRSRILVFASTSTHRHIPHGPTSCPVSLAVLAEMPGLVDIVIVVVTELGIHAITAGAWQYLVWFL